jgi:hypothetical protein
MRYVLILLVFVSCNPVRQVLKDPLKFEAVADEMIKRGYCLNDTTYIHSTDTLEVHDTTTMVLVDTTVINDTTYLWETKFQTITKVRTIRDSIKSVVIDSAQVQVLRKQLAAANGLKDAALKDMKGLRKILQIGAAAAAVFFLLLFKLK